MKLSVLQENLSKGLKIVSRAVNNRSVLPVLSNILLSAEEDHLKLAATDLEFGISIKVGANIEKQGAVTIPARLLTDFVNSLPSERVDMVLDEATQTLNLKCANFEANMKGIPAKEFPAILTLNQDDQIITLDQDHFKRIVNRVAFAAATEESRPILTGVQLHFEPGRLSMSASDGFRLSKDAMALEGYNDNQSVVVLARSMIDLAKMIDDEPIKMAVRHSQILFQLGNIDVASYILGGDYPDLNGVIPTDKNTRVIAEVGGLLKATKVASLFARDAANIVKFSITPGDGNGLPGTMALSANSQDTGDNVSEIEIDIDGEAIEIAFNALYFGQALSVLDSPKVVLETVTSTSAGVMRVPDDDNFIHIIMPMHMT